MHIIGCFCAGSLALVRLKAPIAVKECLDLIPSLIAYIESVVANFTHSTSSCEQWWDTAQLALEYVL